MPNVYIEACPKGRPEGSAIDDYVGEDHVNHALHTAKKQEKDIEWARNGGHKPLIAHVGVRNAKSKPDHWREG